MRPDPDNLVNLAEAARIIGVCPERASQLAASDPAFPAPLREWARLRVFWRPEVVAYAARPRPPAVARGAR